ncbi:MAG: hypothetical protein J6V74_06940 [Bacteroidales bacterium]|nr:hypothetical protein [Bacteroidales bacterium]
MDIEELHIGDWIRKVAVQQNVTVAELARKLGMSRQNLTSKLKNDSWEVKELFAVSQELNYNFFSPFVTADEKPQAKKFVLQLEVDENKIPEILRIIGNSNLTKLVR